MDGELKEAIDLLSKRIESTIEIIMEHLKDTEQRLEDMEARDRCPFKRCRLTRSWAIQPRTF